MPLTFSGGSALPTVGSAAYNAAASSSVNGTGTYDSKTGTVMAGNAVVYSPPKDQVQQSTTGQRQITTANMNDFNNTVLPGIQNNSATPQAPGAQVKINKGDTLSALAARYGVSVNDFVAANKGNTAALPDANNPNLIIAGAQLNIPKSPSAPSDSKTGAPAPAADAGAGGGAGGGGSGAGGNTGSGSTEKGNTNTSTYDDGTEVVTGNQLIDKQIKLQKAEGERQISAMQNTLEQIKSSSNAATQALIQALQGQYNSAKADIMDKLKNTVGSLNVMNNMSGRAEFAPVLAQGYITTAEVNAQMKISDLFNKMMLSVSKAQQAQSNNDLNTFNKEYANTKAIKDSIAKSVQDLYKLNTDNEKAKAAAAKEKAAQDQQVWKNSLDNSKRSAPGIAAELSTFKTDKEKVDFLQKYSDKTGIPIDILFGDVTSEMNKNSKDALSAANIKSEISNRAKSKSATGLNPTQQAQQDARDLNEMVYNFMDGKKADDGTITQADYDLAKKAAVAGGMKPADFDKQYKDQFTIK